MQSRPRGDKLNLPAGADSSLGNSACAVDAHSFRHYRFAMRAALAPFLFTFVFTSSLFAIDRENGKIVQGKYFASGSASTAGVKVQYLLSKAFVTFTATSLAT